MCEIGRINICTEVSMLSSYSAMPRVGHFEGVLHMFAYLKQHHNSRLVFDPKKPDTDTDMSDQGFVSSDGWGAEYQGAEELIPVDATYVCRQ